MKKLKPGIPITFTGYGLKRKKLSSVYQPSTLLPFIYPVRRPYRVSIWLKSGTTKIVASGKPVEVSIKRWYNGHIRNKRGKMIDSISTKKLYFIV